MGGLYSTSLGSSRVEECLAPKLDGGFDALLPSGQTLLVDAIKEGDQRLVDQLLVHGANVHVANCRGQLPLHVAALSDQPGIVEGLLKAGADGDQASTQSLSALQLAYLANNTATARLLVEYSVGVENSDHGRDCVSTALSAATKHGNTDLVQCLLSKGASVNELSKLGEYALITAVKYRHKHLVKMYLDQGADPNCRSRFGVSALHCAVIADQCDVTNMLLEAGSDVDPIHSCLTNYCVNYSPLGAAIHRNCLDCVNNLLQAGASLNLEDNSGREPLFYALTNEHWRCDTKGHGEIPGCYLNNASGTVDDSRWTCLRLLLQRGADIEPTWEKLIWYCRQFSTTGREVTLCLRSLPLPNPESYKVSAFFRALISNKACGAALVLYWAGYNPEKDVINMVSNLQLGDGEMSRIFKQQLKDASAAPRTLQNLCVVTIRGSMSGSGNVLNKTERLPLPPSLKNLVTLNVT